MKRVSERIQMHMASDLYCQHVPLLCI